MSEIELIARYTDVTNTEDFSRGRFDLEIYQHKSLNIIYEIKEFHDTFECCAFLFRDGKQLFSMRIATVEMVSQATFDVREFVLNECANDIMKMIKANHEYKIPSALNYYANQADKYKEGK